MTTETLSDNPTREEIEAGMKAIEAMMTDLINLATRFDGVALERLFDIAVHAKELYGEDTDPPLTHNIDLDNVCRIVGLSALAIAHDLAAMQYTGGPLGLDVFKWSQNELRPTLLARMKSPRESQVVKRAIDRILYLAMGSSTKPEVARCPEEH